MSLTSSGQGVLLSMDNAMPSRLQVLLSSACVGGSGVSGHVLAATLQGNLTMSSLL